MTHTDGIGIIRVPPPDTEKDASAKAVINISQLSSNIFDHVYVFDDAPSETEDNICSVPVKKYHYQNLALRIFSHLHFQIKLALLIFKMRDGLSTVLWHAGGYSLILPILTTKILDMEMYLCVLGDPKRGFANREYWGRASIVLSPTIMVLNYISYSFADKIIVLSDEGMGDGTVKKFGHKIHELKFNYESVPTDVQEYSERDKNVAYLGRICDLKGAGIFAESIKKLESGGENSVNKYLFIGDGNMKDELCSDLNDYIHNDKVEFTGWLDRTDAMRHIENSWMFVLPSHSEGLPKALQEAMARGTVPITSSVGSIPDIINSGENGILLDENNPTELARSIKGLLSNEKKANHMSDQARRTAQDELSFETALEEFESMVEG